MNQRIRRIHFNCIEKKLNSCDIASIEKINRLPTGISYLTWSIGSNGQLDNYYKIYTLNSGVVYCNLISFMRIFILQSLFFREEKGVFIRMFN